MLGKLFLEADARGIPRERVREEIAPGLLNGKRLSAASEREISLVLTHVAGPMKKQQPRRGERIPQAHNSRTWKKYDSSIQGLRDEICDLAKARWGMESWERSLNSLCNRFGVKRWQWLDYSHGRELKSTIIRMQSADADSSDRR